MTPTPPLREAQADDGTRCRIWMAHDKAVFGLPQVYGKDGWRAASGYEIFDYAATFTALRAAPYAPTANPVRDAILTALENANRSHAPWDLPAHADALATTLRPLIRAEALREAETSALVEEFVRRGGRIETIDISRRDCATQFANVLVLPTATTNTEGK